MMRWKIIGHLHTQIFYSTQCILLCKNSTLSSAHAFDYVVLIINPGLTNCKDLATVVDNSLDNK